MTNDVENGLLLQPKFGADGLLTAVVTDRQTGALLMVAHMNQEALDATLATGEGHFWSRSRQAQWKKGESSGNVLRVVDVRVDCDQDAIWLIVDPAGPTCHTGMTSCFYRRVVADGSLERLA